MRPSSLAQYCRLTAVFWRNRPAGGISEVGPGPSMSAVTVAPHRLLLSHFTTWLRAKNREVDVQLLESLLDLRATHDDLEPTLWPAGSVQDLLLRLVPAKGPAEPLPSDDVVNALDAYFRFLRSTGRMSARSAPPADLAKEARRSAKKMAAAARDRTNWSPSKSVIDYGASIGLSLDNLSSVEELQGRLDQISAAWNELPIHERQQLDPPTGNLSGCSRAMAAYRTDNEVEALIRSFSYELPQGELPSPAEVAPLIRKAGLFSQLEALTHWIEPRAEVTATGVLRPATARQAYEDLGLAAWSRESLRHRFAFLHSRIQSTELETVLDTMTAAQSWRSARDCQALDRLWNAALTSRVIRIEGRWAYPAWPEQLDDDGVVDLATGAGLDLLFSYLDHDMYFGLPALCYALLRSYVRRPRPVALEEIEDFAASWSLLPAERADPDYPLLRRMISSSLSRVLFNFRDLGIFSETKDEIALTAWGDVFVSAWLSVELEGLDDDR
jgi:hypothetical protein